MAPLKEEKQNQKPESIRYFNIKLVTSSSFLNTDVEGLIFGKNHFGKGT